MLRNKRDINAINHIIEYCDDIAKAVNDFGKDISIFENNKIYKNAVSMCILQIGELVGILSDDLKTENNDVAWKEIRGMRNVIVHDYGNVRLDVTWETVINDIPLLKEQCVKIIADSAEEKEDK